MLLRLDGKGAMYGQIYRALRVCILDGRLSAGVRVPSTRAISDELGVSRTIAVLAYEQLLSEGYLSTRTGAGTFVANELPESLTMVSDPGSVGRERPHAAMPRLSSYATRIGGDAAVERFFSARQRSALPYDFRYGRPSFADFPHGSVLKVQQNRARQKVMVCG